MDNIDIQNCEGGHISRRTMEFEVWSVMVKGGCRHAIDEVTAV